MLRKIKTNDTIPKREEKATRNRREIQKLRARANCLI
jgi:hypothetical protein